MNTLRISRVAGMLVALVATAGIAAAGTPPPTDQLQDIPVFQDQLFGTWSGGDIVTTGPNNDQLPIDSTETYNGLPSLRLQIVGPNQWWWASILAGQDWMPYSLEHYVANGYLEFNVKGSVGGEVFNIQVGDFDYARTPSETTLDNVGSWNYVWLSTSWQHVRIPLSALIPPEKAVPQGTFEPRQFRVVRFGEAYWGPYAKTIWLNDLKFTSADREPSAPAIRVNQVGYLPIGEKDAYVADFPEVLNADTGTRFEIRSADNN